MSQRLGLFVAIAACLVSRLAFADCWINAGSKYGVEPHLLKAIALVESGGRKGAINVNRDGSRDLGLMQINSMHLPRLRQQGITEQRLLSDPCLSIDVGASILADFITFYGYNWTAVGAYNAGYGPSREVLRLRYARKVWSRYAQLAAGKQEPSVNLIE